MNDKYKHLNPADDIFDHDHLDPETLQERADEAREAMVPDVPKPEYRFNCEIVDTKTDEVVIKGWSLLDNKARYGEPVLGLENLSEESAEMEFWSMLRAFRDKIQEKYEEKNYSVEKEDE